MKNKFLAGFILFAALLVLTPVFGAQEYSDLPSSHWAHGHVSEMSEMGIIEGYPDGTFRPGNKVTYAEFIKMMYVVGTGENVPQDSGIHWAMNYYTQSIKVGLLSGSDIKLADLDKVIPRKHMALIVCGLTRDSIRESEAVKVLAEVNDVDVSSDCGFEIAASYRSGILNGYPDGSFKPESGLTRAEAAAAVHRMSTTNSNKAEMPVEFLGSVYVSNRDYYVDTYSAQSGYKGIRYFKYSEESDCIGVYSDKIQDMSLYIDSTKASQVVNTNGEFWKEGDSYVYVFKASGMYKSGCRIGLSFGVYDEEVYYYPESAVQ